MNAETLRRALPAGTHPATDLLLLGLAGGYKRRMEQPGAPLTSPHTDEHTARLIGPVLARLAEEMERNRTLQARYDALAEEATRYLTAGLLEETGGDGCPAGDPECMAPDDGEWHCHDACEAPEPATEGRAS